jgi:hypothetical protein
MADSKQSDSCTALDLLQTEYRERALKKYDLMLENIEWIKAPVFPIEGAEKSEEEKDEISAEDSCSMSIDEDNEDEDEIDKEMGEKGYGEFLNDEKYINSTIDLYQEGEIIKTNLIGKEHQTKEAFSKSYGFFNYDKNLKIFDENEEKTLVKIVKHCFGPDKEKENTKPRHLKEVNPLHFCPMNLIASLGPGNPYHESCYNWLLYKKYSDLKLTGNEPNGGLSVPKLIKSLPTSEIPIFGRCLECSETYCLSPYCLDAMAGDYATAAWNYNMITRVVKGSANYQSVVELYLKFYQIIRERKCPYCIIKHWKACCKI